MELVLLCAKTLFLSCGLGFGSKSLCWPSGNPGGSVHGACLGSSKEDGVTMLRIQGISRKVHSNRSSKVAREGVGAVIASTQVH